MIGALAILLDIPTFDGNGDSLPHICHATRMEDDPKVTLDISLPPVRRQGGFNLDV